MDQENKTVNNQQGNREVVDGFSDVDTNNENGPGSPDPGTHSRVEPMTADERARAEQEIREGDQEGHQGNKNQ